MSCKIVNFYLFHDFMELQSMTDLEESLGEGRSSISDTVTWLRFAGAVVVSLCPFSCTLVTNGLSVCRVCWFVKLVNSFQQTMSSLFLIFTLD